MDSTVHNQKLIDLVGDNTLLFYLLRMLTH